MREAMEEAVEQTTTDDAAALAQVNELHTRLTALRERYNSLINLAQDRARHLHEPDVAANGADPDQLEAQAAEALKAAGDLSVECAQLVTALGEREARTTHAEGGLAVALRDEQQRQQQVAQYRETSVRLQGLSIRRRRG